MLLFLTIPTSPITFPANSGIASNFNFPALGQAVSLLFRTNFDQNKENRSLERRQKGERKVRDLRISNFDGLVCGKEDSLRGQVKLKSFAILLRLLVLKLNYNTFIIS